MEISNVYDLIDRFDNSDITSMKLEMEGMKLSLSRDPASQNKAEYGIKNIDNTENNDASRNKDIEGSINNKTEKSAGYEVKAPLSGMFYTAATPEAEPFVKVGTKVTKGDVIGIIEAMKMMNEVKSTEAGTIVKILVEDGVVVKKEEVLFEIK